MCNDAPAPTRHTTSRRRSGQPLSHSAGPRPSAPPAGAPPTATRPRPARAVRHTAEHFVQKVTDCAQSNLDSSLSTQNITLYTKRPHTPPPPTRPGTPTLHRQNPPHPRLNSLKNLRPTPKTRHTTSPPTPLAPQTPPPRTSTVLTRNKYRSREEGEGRGGRSRASASSRLLLCPGTPGQQPRSLPL